MFEKHIRWLVALFAGIVFFVPALNHWFDEQRPSLLVLAVEEGLPLVVSLCFEGLIVALLVDFLRKKA